MPLFGILAIIAAAWVILDVMKREDKTSEQRVVWVVAAVVASIATAVVYYVLEKKDKNTNNQ